MDKAEYHAKRAALRAKPAPREPLEMACRPVVFDGAGEFVARREPTGETPRTVRALWERCTGEQLPRTFATTLHLQRLIECLPAGGLWAIIPDVWQHWNWVRRDMAENKVWPLPSHEPNLADLAEHIGHFVCWWLRTNTRGDKYAEARKLGLGIKGD